MESPPAPPTPRTRAARSDGVEARARLLDAALRLFAVQGFAKTSTREIAQAAGVNIAAISYYFGDKAGLYRSVFTEPLGSPEQDIPRYNQPDMPLRAALEGFFSSFLEPMKQSDLVQHCMRLHFREMLEPTGLWQQELEQGIKPAHAAIVAVLCRHLDLTEPDLEVHRLAFAVTGLALQLFVGREVVDAIRPDLVATPEAIDAAASRLADFAEAMVRAEADRRAAHTAKTPSHRATSPASPTLTQGTDHAT